MTDFTVVVASPVGNQLIQHTEFLARVSVPAAKRFRNEYANKKNDMSSERTVIHGLHDNLFVNDFGHSGIANHEAAIA